MSSITDDNDAELLRLKAQRLAEMQKNINMQKIKEQTTVDKPTLKKITPRDVIVKLLGFRGLEVLESAERQYPAETNIVIQRLADIVQSENITEKIDGGQLMGIFRMLGLPVKIKTSIKIEDDGKFVSLSDKLKNKSS